MRAAGALLRRPADAAGRQAGRRDGDARRPAVAGVRPAGRPAGRGRGRHGLLLSARRRRTRPERGAPRRVARALRSVDTPQTGRGDAAAAAWIFHGDESRRRRGSEPDRPPRSESPEGGSVTGAYGPGSRLRPQRHVEIPFQTSRGDAAAATWIYSVEDSPRGRRADEDTRAREERSTESVGSGRGTSVETGARPRYHRGLGFDRVHYYDMSWPRDDGDARRVLAHYEAQGFLEVHDWTPAGNPGPLWGNTGATWSQEWRSTKRYAQALALYDCFLREHASGTSDWMFYGDVDELIVAPLVAVAARETQETGRRAGGNARDGSPRGKRKRRVAARAGQDEERDESQGAHGGAPRGTPDDRAEELTRSSWGGSRPRRGVPREYSGGGSKGDAARSLAGGGAVVEGGSRAEARALKKKERRRRSPRRRST